MTIRFKTTAVRLASATLTGAAAASLVAASVPAAAQDANPEARLRRIEAEVRALQRKVFPGGDGRFFEPQIAPGTPNPASPAAPSTSAPSANAVTDILIRLDTLESQLQRLTARSEEQSNALAQLETRLAALETAGSASMAAAAPAPSIQPAPTLPPAASRPPAPGPAPAPAAAAAASPSAARLAAVQAIAKPQTADPGDDEYSYGFRLWNAGFYPEARQQLTKYVEQYPNHSRISFGRNLLGRAFLDDKMPKEAAQWFLKNYQANKAGDRAPDSLLYLGAAMIAMGDTKRACIALAEFAETYPLIASGRLASEYQANRAKVKCN
jgi:TolA-binding protein